MPMAFHIIQAAIKLADGRPATLLKPLMKLHLNETANRKTAE
jgi:hypothetical protein